MSSVNFFAKAYINKGEIDRIETYVHEHHPIASGRSGDDWVHDHITNSCWNGQLDTLCDLTGLVYSEFSEDKNYEIIFNGDLRGFSCGEYDMEYDEELTVEDISFVELPLDYFDPWEPEKQEMVQLQ